MSVSESENSRERTLTEKGFEYQLSVSQSNCRLSLSAWRRRCGQALSLLSDSKNVDAVRDHRNLLIGSFDKVITTYDKLKALKDVTKENDVLDNVEGEHHQILKQISNCIRELEVANDLGSGVSRRSRRSNISEAAARNAILKADLKYLDMETRCKAEAARIKILKQIEITQAEMEALNFEATETQSESKQAIPTSRDYVHSVVKNDSIPAREEANISYPSVTQPTSLAATCISHATPRSVSSVPLATDYMLNPNADTFDSHSTTQVPITQSTWSHKLHPYTPTQPYTPYTPKSLTNDEDNDVFRLIDTFAKQINLSRLPTPEPGIFSGDPLRYPGWKAAFHTLIEQSNIPPGERLYYLKRYLSDSVREVIEGCFLLYTDDAYEKAKKMLDSRYGDPYLISNAFRDKLDKWSKIQSRDSNSLQKFSDFLLHCEIAMQNISGLKVLNDDRENKKLLAKLPDWLVVRWSRTVFNWKRDKGQFPPFKEFAHFVAQESKIASDPITSLSTRGSFDEIKTTKSYSKPERKFPSSRSFHSKASENIGNATKPDEMKCVLCQRSHELDYCKGFLNKPMPDRKAFIKEKNLCYACLGSGHISKKCRQRKQCKVCSKYHPTSLHGDVWKPETDSSSERSDS